MSKRLARHQIKDMVLECTWGQRYQCRPEDFELTWTYTGPCFTFNAGYGTRGSEDSPYIVNETTSWEGLWIRLNLEQYDYLATLYDTAGFKIPSKKYPYVTNCSDSGLKFYDRYSLSTCFVECLTDTVLTECGCLLPYTVVEGQDVCDFQKIVTCAYNVIAAAECPCDAPCVEEQYNTRASLTSTPAQYALPKLMDKYNMTADEIRNNIVDLYIYFEDMRLTVIEHNGAYDLPKLASDVGGELGLLLGASILTLFEFIDFVSVYYVVGCSFVKNCYCRFWKK